jgi:hypothetical protein
MTLVKLHLILKDKIVKKKILQPTKSLTNLMLKDKIENKINLKNLSKHKIRN